MHRRSQTTFDHPAIRHPKPIHSSRMCIFSPCRVAIPVQSQMCMRSHSALFPAHWHLLPPIFNLLRPCTHHGCRALCTKNEPHLQAGSVDRIAVPRELTSPDAIFHRGNHRGQTRSRDSHPPGFSSFGGGPRHLT